MDTKKIGEFLKQNRKNKNLTQEQLAEILGVSGRTISRWETGTNIPDLCILIQLADYYDIEVKDILDGGKKGETMNTELKETLVKIADYSEYEKEKVISAGCTAFGVMFLVCAVMIIIQMVVTTELIFVLGETITLVLGGIMYCLIMVHNGIWESNSKFKSTLWHDIIISITCAGTFSLLYSLCLIRLSANKSQVLHLSLLFFIGIALIGFLVLRLLVIFSRKRKSVLSNEIRFGLKQNEKSDSSYMNVKIYNAKDIIEANLLVDILKENGIEAYAMNSSNEVSMHTTIGFGMYGVDIITNQEYADKAIKIITQHNEKIKGK